MTTKTSKSLVIGKNGLVADYQTLTKEQEETSRNWARTNWSLDTNVNPTWHPVIRDEWTKLTNAYNAQQRAVRTSVPFQHNVAD